ncbi:MAG: toll/interleukin-1 receptor domain-containing protein, partial [Sphingobacteriaceae bacterium]
MKQEEKQYHFFISHASEDKDDFVRPLAEKLIDNGYKIWYDEMSLNVGDSLVENISNWIKKSTYGIVILSKNFFKKKWTKKELNVLLNKEIISESNLILPVWLDVGLDEVFDFSPFLVDKLAIQASAKKIDDVVLKLGNKFKLEHTSESMVKEKIQYLIDCNDDRRNKYFLDLEKRIKSIFLYQQEYYNWYTSDDVFNNDNQWDDILVDKKGKELATEYGLVQGIW